MNLNRVLRFKRHPLALFDRRLLLRRRSFALTGLAAVRLRLWQHEELRARDAATRNERHRHKDGQKRIEDGSQHCLFA